MIKPVNSYVQIQKIKEHSQIKDELLALIDKMPDGRINDTQYESITKSDFYLPKQYIRHYADLFLKIIQPYNENTRNFYKADEFWISRYWFQQYENSDYHNWHVHSHNLLSSVYYIEMENKNSTLFYDYVTKEEYSFELEEGDLITFPSVIAHKSQSNLLNRKTIISYNSNFNKINL
tara:strand:- start:173 stop:703 length:531 start_codon:yes stop_codon:yes gene_type:complete